MIRSVALLVGCLLLISVTKPASAQWRRNAGVNSVYGRFSAAEMQQAGGDPAMAGQLREQRQLMQYQQQMYKQQQQFMQQQAKQQDFLKKHPEAGKALTTPTRATKKAATKTEKKDKTIATAPPATTTGTPASSKKAKKTD